MPDTTIQVARFLSEDTFSGYADDPLSLNLYTYCHNEPIMYIDPTGHLEQGERFSRNDKGCKDDVEALQKKLKELGYDIGKYGADGIFGKDTEKALNKYKDTVLPGGNKGSNRGVVGASTWKSLGLKLENNNPAAPSPTPKKDSDKVNEDGSTNTSNIHTALPGMQTHKLTNPGTDNVYGVKPKEFNSAIRDAQICLSSMNYSLGDYGYDGLIGPNTTAAILDFQKKFATKYNLSPTGKLDEATLRAIQQEAFKSLFDENEEYKKEIAASGSLLSKTDYVLSNPKYYLNFKNSEQSDIDPIFAGRLGAFARDHEVVVYISGNGGKRDYDDQVRAFKSAGGLYDSVNKKWYYPKSVPKNKRLAAVPGTSFHEFGEAIDILDNNTSSSNYLKQLEYYVSIDNQTELKKYGLMKPMYYGNSWGKNENWHIQPTETLNVKGFEAKNEFLNAYKNTKK